MINWFDSTNCIKQEYRNFSASRLRAHCKHTVFGHKLFLPMQSKYLKINEGQIIALSFRKPKRLQRSQVWQELTLSHHAGTQALLETAGLAWLPPSLGDLTVIHHRTTVLNVSWNTNISNSVYIVHSAAKSYFTLFIFTLFKKPEKAEIFLLSQY